MIDEYNFTQYEAIIYGLTGYLPKRIIPIIGKKLHKKIDRMIFEELIPLGGNL